MAVTLSKYRNKITIFLLLIVGLALMVLGHFLEGYTYKELNLTSLLVNLGAYVSVIIVLQFIYDSWIKDQYHKDAFSIVIGAGNVKNSGICDFYSNSKDFDYSELIRDSESIEFFIHTSARLFKDYIEDWEFRVDQKKETNIFLMKQGGKAEAYMSSDYEVDDINSDKHRLREIANQIDPEDRLFVFRYHDFKLAYNIFKFDDCIIIVLATTTKHKAAVPLLVLQKNSSLYSFVLKDMERIKNECANQE